MKLRFATRNQNVSSHPNTSQRRRSVVERQRRTHLLLVCVVAVFAVAWLPLNVFHIFNTFELVNSFSVTTFSICHCLAMCSACLNPLIYAFFNHNFRTEFIYLFDRVGLRSLRILIFGEQESFKKSLKTEFRSRGCKTATTEPTSFQRMNESIILIRKRLTQQMQMFSLFLIVIINVMFEQKNVHGCVTRCKTIQITGNLVPTQYNRCLCFNFLKNDLESSRINVKCSPNYRSLKFRDKETGVIVLHKAVVAACIGLNSRKYVNQSDFDIEEQLFLTSRNFHVNTETANFKLFGTPQKNSWIDDFRSNIMQLYRKPDGHLRFG
ncbi:unnamed protein product [Caenorhabditis sp. 36 PRJEB53466]|nr:unnamed protein product [Caenorhabditis sp. 36 PRJEB53466]